MAEKETAVEKLEGELLDTLKNIDMGIGNSNESTWKKVVKDLSKAPVPKQIGVGAATGWCAGYVTMKLGKMAATAIGGSLLLLQIAHHKGYVKIDWNKMTDDSTSLADRMKDKLKFKSKSGLEKFQDFAKENIYVAGGFTAGFFLGIASS